MRYLVLWFGEGALSFGGYTIYHVSKYKGEDEMIVFDEKKTPVTPGLRLLERMGRVQIKPFGVAKTKPAAKPKTKVEKPKVEEPKVEEPKVEEPKVEEPKVEEPKVEEPKVEEPKVEEPKVEEPKVEAAEEEAKPRRRGRKKKEEE